VLQVERLERHMAALSAALVPQNSDALSLVEDARREWDAALAAEPVPESDSARLARELGISRAS
jgi:hypothetical protein